MHVILIHYTVYLTLKNRKCGNKIHSAGQKLNIPIYEMEDSTASVVIRSVVKAVAIYFSVTAIPFYKIPILADIPPLRKGNHI